MKNSKSSDNDICIHDSNVQSTKVQLLIDSIRLKNLTYLSNKKLNMLAQTCIDVLDQNVSGSFIEAGCALGGSAILISKLKGIGRQLDVYDVFGMIPPPSDADPAEVHHRYKIISEGRSVGINGNKYYGYVHNLMEVVKENFRTFDVDFESENIQLIQGLIQNTLHPTGNIALAHIDVDWYEPVLTCLERITPHLSIGACIILDDYNDWGGCRKATDEFLASSTLSFSKDDSARSLKLRRLPD
jgi:hypothetical protein